MKDFKLVMKLECTNCGYLWSPHPHTTQREKPFPLCPKCRSESWIVRPYKKDTTGAEILIHQYLIDDNSNQDKKGKVREQTKERMRRYRERLKAKAVFADGNGDYKPKASNEWDVELHTDKKNICPKCSRGVYYWHAYCTYCGWETQIRGYLNTFSFPYPSKYKDFINSIE